MLDDNFGTAFVISSVIRDSAPRRLNPIFNRLIILQRMHETTDISTEIIEAVADKKGSRIAVVDLSGIDGASTSSLWRR